MLYILFCVCYIYIDCLYFYVKVQIFSVLVHIKKRVFQGLFKTNSCLKRFIAKKPNQKSQTEMNKKTMFLRALVLIMLFALFLT